MTNRFLSLLLLSALCHFVLPTYGCTIFMANDGKNVWIGNNEDEIANKKYRLWYYPAKKQNYGHMIWTELLGGKMLHGLSFLNPQGGMNVHGLFMDYTAINYLPAVLDPHKKNRKKELVRDILKKCKTVKEALDYINRYNLIKLTGAQLFIGDATGDYAIVHGSYVIKKSESCFALTNYRINNGYMEKCWRREIATQALTNTPSFELGTIKDILNRTCQRDAHDVMTNYSMAIDIKTKTIHLFYKQNFNKNVVINLENELKKGKHNRNMGDMFL